MTTQASGGALWQITNDEIELTGQYQLGQMRLDEVHHRWPGHSESLKRVAGLSQSERLSATFEQEGKSLELQLLFIPISDGQRVQYVIELFFSQQSQINLERIEQSVSQLLEWAKPQTGTTEELDSLDFSHLLAELHQSLNFERTCYAIVNGVRAWSGWDRVSLVLTNGRGCHLEAVSGIDVLDRRSSTVQVLEKFAKTLQEQRGPLESDQAEPHSAVADYHKRVQSQRTCSIPLFNKESRQLTGLLILDHFSEQAETQRPLSELTLAARHAEVALQHATHLKEAQQGFLSRLGSLLRSSRTVKFLLASCMLICATTFLIFYRTTLTISGTGLLEPTQSQDIFANANALIQKLHVQEGEQVTVDQKLITLRSPELEFELKRLSGELATVTQQRTDLEKLRTDPRRVLEQGQSAEELAAREAELKTVEKNLAEQINLVERQKEELTLLSPIEGTILTWNLNHLLTEDRPVSRTDRLLSIAELNGDWTARLLVDYRDTRHVLRAVEQQTAKAVFVTADAPDHEQQAEIVNIAPQLRTNAIHGTTLAIEGQVHRADIPEIRPGTTILYRIDCGQAPIGYVWFRRLIDKITIWWSLL